MGRRHRTYTATEIVPPVVKNTIVKQPEDIAVDSGESVQFHVEAEGNVVSYKWEYRKLYKWFATEMEGATKATVGVITKVSNNGYKYRCEIIGLDGITYYSEITTLTIG